MPRRRVAIGPMFEVFVSGSHATISGDTREDPYNDVMVGSRDAC